MLPTSCASSRKCSDVQKTLPIIAQNAYCSRDIYFQLKKCCRSVISRVIMHKRLERASIIGCHERTKTLIKSMKATNLTMNAERYCLFFCFAKLHIINMRILRTEHFMTRFSILLYSMGNFLDSFCLDKSYNSQRMMNCQIISAQAK